MELQQTRLYERHRGLGARITEFGGWMMPLDYGSIIEEHRQVRKNAGLFDVSHMGKLIIKGNEALEGLQRLLTIDVGKVPVGIAHYALLCNEQGGVIDDLIMIRPDGSSYLLIVNAANKDKDLEWATKATAGLNLGIGDAVDIGILALQGPESEKILGSVANSDLSALSRNNCATVTVAGVDVFLSRTGYTGEDGFELYPMGDDILRLWDTLLDRGITPCGLGARDTLRLEASLPLYGHELTETTNPLEAGLGWVVHLDKQGFIAKNALADIKQNGPERKLVCLEILGRNVARTGFPLLKDGVAVGHVTSGSFSPTLNKSIAMGYVPIPFASLGTQLEVSIRERTAAAIIVKKPFYKGSAWK